LIHCADYSLFGHYPLTIHSLFAIGKREEEAEAARIAEEAKKVAAHTLITGADGRQVSLETKERKAITPIANKDKGPVSPRKSDQQRLHIVRIVFEVISAPPLYLPCISPAPPLLVFEVYKYIYTSLFDSLTLHYSLFTLHSHFRIIINYSSLIINTSGL